MAKSPLRLAAVAAMLCACPVLATAQGSSSAATPAPAGQAVNPPASAPAAPAASAAPPAASANTGAAANANATTPSLSSGLAVKDNTGATIGQIAALKTDASGKQMATIKMGADSFTVDAANLAVQNGAAVINLTQAQITSMVHKTKP